jgi:hypothetical protein
MSQHITFTNPATGFAYVWPNNPPLDGISASQKQRTITRTSNTANVGSVKQQGDDGPYVLHVEPHVFTVAFETALWQWWTLCRTQTIYWTDIDGAQYEGQIITMSRQQVGALAGPGDIRARKFYAKYVIEFEIYRFISGVMAGVTP